MGSMQHKEIGGYVSTIETWNPSRSESNGEFKYIDLSSVSQDEKVISDYSMIKPEEAPSRARQIVRTNDVLVATVRPNLNSVALVNDAFDGATASTGYCVLRSKPGKLNFKYLYYWVRTNNFINEMVHLSTGANYPAVSDRIIKNSHIPLPDYEEQKRIAAILDKADAIRRKHQQAIHLADELLRSVFLDMFGDPVTNSKGWDVSQLGHISIFENGDRSGKYPSGSDIVEDGMLFLNTKNIKNNILDLKVINFITIEKFQSLSRGHLHQGDLVITLRGTLGNCAIFNCEYETGFINAQIMIIRPSDVVTSDFLHAFITTVAVNSLMQRMGQGAAVPQLTAKQISELRIYVPPMDKQKKFAQIKRKLLSLLSTYEWSNQINIFASISQKAFAGQL